MNGRTIALVALLAAGFGACQQTPVDPGPNPTPATMTFKSGARYQVDSYQSDPSTGQKVAATERTKTWTLVNTSATLYGRAGVAVYVDSVVAGGPIITIADSVLLQQSSGSNYVNRYASLAPELDFTGASVVNVDLGRQWMQEVRLNASVANWFVGESADTVQISLSIPGFQGLKVGVVDSAVASSNESITIDGTSYTATKTTHHLVLSISVLVQIPILGVQSVQVKSETLGRTTWTVPSLGVIAHEEREGRVINVSGTTVSGVTIPSFTLPVPGYFSVVTKVM